MKHLALFIIALTIVSCSSPTTKTVETDTAATDGTQTEPGQVAPVNSPSAITALCFLRTEGTRNQDTTTIQLVMKGGTVTGEMNWLPSLKDGRRGLLSGRKNGDKIDAMWTFKQEGMTDSIAVAFKLTGNQLAQKPLKADPKTGRQSTDDAADYTLMYQSSNSLRPK